MTLIDRSLLTTEADCHFKPSWLVCLARKTKDKVHIKFIDDKTNGMLFALSCRSKCDVFKRTGC